MCRQPELARAAVLGDTDPPGTERVKACIQRRPGWDGDRDLEQDIKDFVNTRLSPHQKPRIIEFVDALPMTVTGKIRRKDLRDAERAKHKQEE